MSEKDANTPLDPSELRERLRGLRGRFEEFRGRL